MNSQPSTPLCQNCLKSRIFCEAVTWSNADERCCNACEHVWLEPAD